VANMALELSKLPDDTIIEVEAVSLESIHPHDLYACKRVTLGSVRSLVTSSPHPWEAF
jgi:GTP cyclohydrolase FolE2